MEVIKPKAILGLFVVTCAARYVGPIILHENIVCQCGQKN